MRYDFSSSFLVIEPPATNFGEAWELLCTDLLAAEQGAEFVRRLAPPDFGIDIYNDSTQHAFQCKASEKGAAGTIPPAASIDSLRSAVAHRIKLPWEALSFCTNAPYSADGDSKVRQAAKNMSIEEERIGFLGPTYWSGLCERHKELIHNRFFYRVTAREKDVIEAFRQAGYYKNYVDKFAETIKEHDFSVVITNNRTPVEIEIPFSPELTVENYLDVAKTMLGVTLKWTNYPDVGTSAGTNLSVTIDQYAQSFSTKLDDLPIESGDPLQLWIKIVWRAKTQESAPSDKQIVARSHRLSQYMKADMDTVRYFKVDLDTIPQVAKPRDPGEVTIERHESLLQGLIWDSFHSLRTQLRASNSVLNEVKRQSLGLHQRNMNNMSRAQREHLANLLGVDLNESDLLHIEVLREMNSEQKL